MKRTPPHQPLIRGQSGLSQHRDFSMAIALVHCHQNTDSNNLLIVPRPEIVRVRVIVDLEAVRGLAAQRSFCGPSPAIFLCHEFGKFCLSPFPLLRSKSIHRVATTVTSHPYSGALPVFQLKNYSGDRNPRLRKSLALCAVGERCQ